MAQALETRADLVRRLLDSDTTGGFLYPSDFAAAAIRSRDEQIAKRLDTMADALVDDGHADIAFGVYALAKDLRGAA